MDIKLDAASASRIGTGTINTGWEADQFLTVKPNVSETQLVIHSGVYADGKVFNRPRSGS